MTAHLIAVSGCDDTTYAQVELTDAEAETVARVFAAVNARSFVDCQPRAEMKPWEKAGANEREYATEKHWSEAYSRSWAPADEQDDALPIEVVGDEGGILCPTCFAMRAPDSLWRLEPANRTEPPPAYICRHGMTEFEHWCDDLADHEDSLRQPPGSTTGGEPR